MFSRSALWSLCYETLIAFCELIKPERFFNYSTWKSLPKVRLLSRNNRAELRARRAGTNYGMLCMTSPCFHSFDAQIDGISRNFRLLALLFSFSSPNRNRDLLNIYLRPRHASTSTNIIFSSSYMLV